MATTIGLELTDVGKDYVCGKIPIDKRTIQSFGFLHGGASVALAETLGSIAGQMQVSPEREIVLGIAINANHIKSVRKGWVYGKASSINIGKKIQVWEIQITDEEKKLVCISRLTLAVLKKR
jgi:1,4-dihydroxy-2-naphthoyl-CoA hydrolase